MLKRIVEAVRKRIQYNRTYKELSKLSNHELRDLGIDRYMITRIAMETTYGKS
jgi:uncharacterized protein YjiS (DUF1127 family)